MMAQFVHAYLNFKMKVGESIKTKKSTEDLYFCVKKSLQKSKMLKWQEIRKCGGGECTRG